MSKGKTFVALAIPLIALYLLALFAYIPTPFLSHSTADKVLPVVSQLSHHCHSRLLTLAGWPPVGLYTMLGCRLIMSLITLRDQTLRKQIADSITSQLPFWLLVSFGAYSLGSLGLGLLRFHDTPEAYESLLKEISQAKTELRDQGVSVD